MPTPPKPTEAELAILRVLWARGPSNVREVTESLEAQRRDGVGYTTALKLMQIMTEKGLLLRDSSNRTHVYRPAFSEDRTLRQLATDLLDRAFGGSTQKLVMSALSAKKASQEELTEIRRLLEEMDGGQTTKGGD